VLRLNVKLVLHVLVIAGGSVLCASAWANSLPLDPFHTDAATTPGPQVYWPKPPDLTVVDNAAPRSAAGLPKHALTLTEVTDFALCNNPDTRLAWYQAKEAAASVGIAQSAYLPTVDGGFGVQYTANVFTSPHSSQTTYGPNFSLNYLLLDFGYRSNTVLSAQYAQIAANLNQNNAIQQVILQVQQAYYQVLGLQSEVAANKQSVKQAKASLAAAEALRANGMATIGDVYQAQASYAQSNLDLQTSWGNYQTALGQLATNMGLPVNTQIDLVPLSRPPTIAQITKSMPQLLAAAKSNRPDLLASEAKVRESVANLAATKASVLPTLTVTGTATPGGFLTNNDTGTTAIAALTLSVPIFTGFNYTYNVRKAQAQYLEAEATRDQLNQQVQQQVWQAYYALKTAEQNVGTTEILLKSSLQANKQAFGQYKSGVGDILTVLTTQATLANARVQAIQAKLNWYVALAQLAAAVGALNSSSIAQDYSL
jgi:outer membrane protein